MPATFNFSHPTIVNSFKVAEKTKIEYIETIISLTKELVRRGLLKEGKKYNYVDRMLGVCLSDNESQRPYGSLFETDFYEHPNYKGAKFSLHPNLLGFNYIRDLSKIKWDKKIASIDTGPAVPLTLCWEYPNFQGKMEVFVTDCNDLREKGWAHTISSVAVATTPVEVTMEIIKRLSQA